jgi:beta-lactamase superfamily II metal-dependent hydrolase
LATLKDLHLQDDLLYLILLGPGYGESILVRVPPNHWLVVDSFTVPIRAKPAVNGPLVVLKQFGAQPSLLVLTHQHEDHTAGFAELVELSPPECLVACTDKFKAVSPNAPRSQDCEQHRRLGNNIEAMNAVQDCWKDQPDKRFVLEAKKTCNLGEAKVTVLHPSQEFLADKQPTNQNELSSPLLLEWKDLRLLLGADLEKHWPSAEKSAPNLHDHQAFKVSHHASQNGLDPVLFGEAGRGSSQRQWWATPWSRNGGLPNFSDGHGPSQILQHIDKLFLTSLPFKSNPVSAPPRQATRASLLSRDSPLGAIEPLPGGIQMSALSPPEDSSVESAWICGGFSQEGKLASLHCGDSAVTVVESEDCLKQ